MSSTPEQTLRDAVRNASDADIDAFATSVGGYPALVPRVLAGLTQRVVPARACSVGFVISQAGDWKVTVANGEAVVLDGTDGVDGTMRMSAPDFLRMMTREVTPASLRGDGRLKVSGDGSAVARLFESVPLPVDMSAMVRADASRVWRALTEELTEWFAEHAEVTPESYDFWGRYTIGTPTTHEEGRHPVLQWEPERLVRFTWRYRDTDTTVELSLSSTDEGTIVRVRHDGAPPRVDGPGLPNFWGLALGYLRVWVELGERAPMLDMSGDSHGGFRFDLDIDAPPAKVFETMHQQQAQQRQPGDTWEIDVGVPIGLEMLSLEPDHEMRIGWTNGDGTSIVTWTLADSGGRTRLTVVHSGMDPDHDAAGEVQGWYDAGALVIKYMCERGDNWRWSNPVWRDAA